jgi:uncharacterized protein (TIGR03435 family)
MSFIMQPTAFHWTRYLLLATAASCCGLDAQTVTRSGSRFEVASVRPNRKDACRGRWNFNASHGTVTAVNAPLLRIVSRAFNLTDDRVSGPGWLDDECYDIKAKVSGNVPDRDLMPMLEQLLQERFHLAAHREQEEKPILALVADKGGVKMRPYSENAPPPNPNQDGKILFMARHLPDLCERLGKVAGRPIVDKTGLDGDYMIVLSYLPLSSTNYDPSDPASDIVSALRDQLGLRLQAQRGVVDMLKIDSIDRIPTAN